MSLRNWKVVLGVGIMLVGVSFGRVVFADGPEKDASVKRYGVVWNVAENRKFENINGVYQPEDLDKYMKRYFEQLLAKTSELSMKIDSLSGQVAQLEAQIKTLSEKKGAAASVSRSVLV